jgi:hypothetical protein
MLNSTRTLPTRIGEVAEWLNAAVSKTAMVQAIGGSNPPLSVYTIYGSGGTDRKGLAFAR